MFKIISLFAAVVAASHGVPPPTNPRNMFTSTYTLFTNAKPNNGQTIQLTLASVRALRITATTDCAIIVHGASDRGPIGVMSTIVRNALFTSGTVNVIVVTWFGGPIDEGATHAIEQVTKDAVELIRLLTTNSKVSRDRLHLIGFDMSAHIVGHIGRTSNPLTIARITGLNPAALENSSNLRGSNVNYAEVIHTETTTLGFPNTMGDVDFYPHGGEKQPGCEKNDVMCSHNRAWELFAASLTHGRIIGNRCNNRDEATSGKPCTGLTLALGTNDMVKYGSGLYHLETNPVYPYRCLVKCGLIDSIIKAIENIIGEDDPETDTTDTTVMTTVTTDATTDTTDDSTDITDDTTDTTDSTTDATEDTTDGTDATTDTTVMTTVTTDATTDTTDDSTDVTDDTTDTTDATTDTTVETTDVTDDTTDTTNDTTDTTHYTTDITDDTTDITDDTTTALVID